MTKYYVYQIKGSTEIIAKAMNTCSLDEISKNCLFCLLKDANSPQEAIKKLRDEGKFDDLKNPKN